jgi:hypothetical protein
MPKIYQIILIFCYTSTSFILLAVLLIIVHELYFVVTNFRGFIKLIDSVTFK